MLYVSHIYIFIRSTYLHTKYDESSLSAVSFFGALTATTATVYVAEADAQQCTAVKHRLSSLHYAWRGYSSSSVHSSSIYIPRSSAHQVQHSIGSVGFRVASPREENFEVQSTNDVFVYLAVTSWGKGTEQQLRGD